MKKLIIAEKSSLAKSIVEGIKLLDEKFESKKTKYGNYYESANYVVCSARGHLFCLCDVEDYTGSKKWSLEILPYIPDTFRFKPIEDASGYINNIAELLKRTDISCVVNAGDSGREGEILIRIILEQLNNTKSVYRLWLPSQVPEEVKTQITNLFLDSEKDSLAREGMGRMYADWLDGINLTRYVSLKTDSFMRVGRVATTIVKLIYDRDKEIEEFVSEKYYMLESEQIYIGTKFKMICEDEFSSDEINDAKRLCKYLNDNICTVMDIKTKESVQAAPKLFSQAKLQNFMNEQEKFPTFKTLSITQSLYEKGYVTYPRTDTEYLATSEKDKFDRIIGKFIGEGFEIKSKSGKSIYDDSKIEEHSAITPTIKFPKLGDLDEEQEKVYNAIKNRFLAVFCANERRIKNVDVVINVADYENITLHGKVILQKGWSIYEQAKDEDTILPNFNVGDTFKSNFETVEKKTSPKKHFSVTTLNNYLENPKKHFNAKDDEEVESTDEDYKNAMKGLKIGTAASLPGIFQKICSDKLIALQGKNYCIMDKGKNLIEALNKLEISIDPQKTIEMNKMLIQVRENKLSIENYLVKVMEDLKSIIHRNISFAPGSFKPEANINNMLGICPRCGKPVIETKQGYKCTGDCKFFLFKSDKFWETKKISLDSSLVKKLLKMKKVEIKKMYSAAKDKYYSGFVTLVDDGEKITYKMEF